MGTDNEKIYQLLIWGTGKISVEIEKNGLNGIVIGYIETHKSKDSYCGLNVYEIDNLPNVYDYIIVANSYTDEIHRICVRHNINIDKCIFIYPSRQPVGCEQRDILRYILGEKNYTNYCAGLGITEETFFEKDMELYQKMNTRESFQIQKDYLYPIISDRYADAGIMDTYFWQDLWAAKLVYQSGVKTHFDIGSRMDGFIAHLLAMDIDVTLIDVRELPARVENLHTIVSDATRLSQVEDESIESMSALCSLEHFGLGRYGDMIDPEACFVCFEAIQRKLKKGASLYISVPIGKERVEFNAHRVFYAKTIVECFAQMDLVEFAYASGSGIEYHIALSKYDNDVSKRRPGFGLFYFIKK